MTFDIRAEIARANAIFYPKSAAQVDAANHARKFAAALTCIEDDARRDNAWGRRWVREYMRRHEENEAR